MIISGHTEPECSMMILSFLTTKKNNFASSGWWEWYLKGVAAGAECPCLGVLYGWVRVEPAQQGSGLSGLQPHQDRLPAGHLTTTVVGAVKLLVRIKVGLQRAAGHIQVNVSPVYTSSEGVSDGRCHGQDHNHGREHRTDHFVGAFCYRKQSICTHLYDMNNGIYASVAEPAILYRLRKRSRFFGQ